MNPEINRQQGPFAATSTQHQRDQIQTNLKAPLYIDSRAPPSFGQIHISDFLFLVVGGGEGRGGVGEGEVG